MPDVKLVNVETLKYWFSKPLYPIDRREMEAIIARVPVVSTEMRWIPCKMELPKINTEVLVTLYKPELDGYFRKIVRFIGGKWLINNLYSASMENVVAWMPLPDAYNPPEIEVNSDV